MLRPRNSSIGLTEDGVPLFPRDAEEWRFVPGGIPDSPSNIIGRTYRWVYAWFRKALLGYYTKEETDTLLAPKYVKPAGGIPASDLAPGVIPRFPVPVDPAGASSVGSYSDAKLTRDLVNKSVSDHSAHYLTYDASGSVFPSAAALRSAESFYYAGTEFVPTNNDWAIVRADEEHPDGGVSPSSKWIYVKPVGSEPGEWQFMVSYRAQFTEAQLAALDSGVSKGKLPMRPLPEYLRYLAFDDTYPADAKAFYDSLGSARVMGGCSVVRKGDLVGGNFDYPYDDACSFAIKVSACKGANGDGSDRHASVGAAYLGTRLTENIVSSGVSTPLYRVLPGMTESGINDAGVYAKINVIPRDESKDPVQSSTRNIHALAVVRYVLDHFDSAEDAAEYIAAHYYIPDGSADSYHWMIADSDGTYVVEDGEVIDTAIALTNYRIGAEDDRFGSGYSRLAIIEGNIPDDSVETVLGHVKFTTAYADGWPWPDEFAGQEDADGRIPHDATARLMEWADEHVAPLLDATRKPAARGNGCWQTVHSAIYDFEKKTMAICAQEDFSKRYVFAVDQADVETDSTVTRTSANPVRSSGIWSAIWGTLSALPTGFSSLYDWCVAKLAEKRDLGNLLVYNESPLWVADTSLKFLTDQPVYNETIHSFEWETSDALYTAFVDDEFYGTTEFSGPHSFHATRYKPGEHASDSIAKVSQLASAIEANEKVGTSQQIVRAEFSMGMWDTKVLSANTADILVYDLPWHQISDTPTTLSGYGITDAAKLSDIIDPALAEAVGKIADAKKTRDFVNLMVSTNSAHYLTARSGTAGAYTYPPFASAAALRAALAAHTEQNPQFFYAGEAFTPTKNDWVIVSEDEDHPLGTITPASRYGFVGTFGSGGSFQYQVSYKLPLTTAQIAALDSGVTKAKFDEKIGGGNTIIRYTVNNFDPAGVTITEDLSAPELPLFNLYKNGAFIATAIPGSRHTRTLVFDQGWTPSADFPEAPILDGVEVVAISTDMLNCAKRSVLLPPAFAAKTSGSYEEGELVLRLGVAYKRNTIAGDDTSWVAAHWTAATDADLANRLKMLKSDGTATDAFATNLLEKQVAKEPGKFVSDTDRTNWNGKRDKTDLDVYEEDPETGEQIPTGERLATSADLGGKQDNLSTQQLANIADVPNKVDIIPGKGLSTNDYTTTEKLLVAGAFQKSNIAVPSSENLTDNQVLGAASAKAFINSSVQTATANFRGNFADWSAVPSDAAQYEQDAGGSRTPTTNDYMVVINAEGFGNYTANVSTGIVGRTLAVAVAGFAVGHVFVVTDIATLTAAGVTQVTLKRDSTWRFKYTGSWDADGKAGWSPEYRVNEAPLTAAQLAALNSGVTSDAVQKADGALRFDAEQTLTDIQKAQLWANLGLDDFNGEEF